LFTISGHPDFVHIGDQVKAALGLATAENDARVRQASVVVIGHGNVALDCARILAKGAQGLYDTDIAAHALPVLGNGVAQISIVGRRGHVQAAFTIKELRELVKLNEEGHDAFFSVDSAELERGTTEASLKELESPAARPKKRIDKLLRDAANAGETLEAATHGLARV
jgi:adrenodoxin-NADP+ reductase